MNDYDFIVVGQGLAGSLLAYYLIKAKKKVLIFNDETLPTSSQVAAGIFNPVTGKDLKKAWRVSEVFDALEHSYKALESAFNIKILHHTKIYRPFDSIEQQNYFLAQTNHQSHNYISEPLDNKHYSPLINNDLGGLETNAAGWIDINCLLDKLRLYFIKNEAYSPQKYEQDKLELLAEGLTYNKLKIDKIIFAEGYYGSLNPFFSWLPFNPVKGEIISAFIDNYDLTEIINQGIFILPLGQNICKIGATYNWDTLDFETSVAAKQNLENKLSNLLKPKHKIIGQQAGVRPSTQDRRPFLGLHPQYKQLCIFNGLGTKGASLAPFFSQHLCDFLLNKKELLPDVNIARHYSLFS